MSDQLDLLNLDRCLTPAERRMLHKAKKTKTRGHAWAPGSGPSGETCGSCRHLTRRRFAKTYLKCWLMKDRWTGGPGTDVKAGDAACKEWKKGLSGHERPEV